MSLVIDALSWGFLVVGSVFAVLGGVGLVRMPGFYPRAHAAGLTDTMGAACILIGLSLQSGFSDVTTKLIIILGFLLVTSPTAVHALVNGAYKRGHLPRATEPELDP